MAEHVNYSDWKYANNNTPRFDGEYLCVVMETEECGAIHRRQRVLYFHMMNWHVKANQVVIAFMKLPDYPNERNP
jgi:hypothetical protein